MNATRRVDRIIDEAAEPLLVTAKVLAMCDDEDDDDDEFAFEIPVAVVIPVAVEVPVVSEIPFAIEVPVATLGVKIGFLLYFCAAVVSVRQLLRESVVTGLLLFLRGS